MQRSRQRKSTLATFCLGPTHGRPSQSDLSSKLRDLLAYSTSMLRDHHMAGSHISVDLKLFYDSMSKFNLASPLPVFEIACGDGP